VAARREDTETYPWGLGGASNKRDVGRNQKARENLARASPVQRRRAQRCCGGGVRVRETAFATSREAVGAETVRTLTVERRDLGAGRKVQLLHNP
jgi:hypothetical protein